VHAKSNIVHADTLREAQEMASGGSSLNDRLLLGVCAAPLDAHLFVLV
jgi:hypothetical protein